MCSVDRAGRPAPTESSVLSVGRPGGRPFFSHGRPGGRPEYSCARCTHRSTGRLIGSYPGLLQCAVLAPLSSDLCDIFLYLMYLLLPKQTTGTWDSVIWDVKNPVTDGDAEPGGGANSLLTYIYMDCYLNFKWFTQYFHSNSWLAFQIKYKMKTLVCYYHQSKRVNNKVSTIICGSNAYPWHLVQHGLTRVLILL